MNKSVVRIGELIIAEIRRDFPKAEGHIFKVDFNWYAFHFFLPIEDSKDFMNAGFLESVVNRILIDEEASQLVLAGSRSNGLTLEGQSRYIFWLPASIAVVPPTFCI
jgi:hypothetical protein